MWEVEIYEVVQTPLGSPPVKPERRPNVQVKAQGIDQAKAEVKKLLREMGYTRIRGIAQKAHHVDGDVRKPKISGPDTVIATVESALPPPSRPRPTITPRMQRSSAPPPRAPARPAPRK